MTNGRHMHMTSKERVFAAINGLDFDVYPAVNPTSVATIDAMKFQAHISPPPTPTP